MTTLDDLARVEREIRFFFSEGSSEILRAWADTIAAFIGNCGWPTPDGGYRHTCGKHMRDGP